MVRACRLLVTGGKSVSSILLTSLSRQRRVGSGVVPERCVESKTAIASFPAGELVVADYIEGHLNRQEESAIAQGTYEDEARDFSRYLNDWSPIKALQASTQQVKT